MEDTCHKGVGAGNMSTCTQRMHPMCQEERRELNWGTWDCSSSSRSIPNHRLFGLINSTDRLHYISTTANLHHVLDIRLSSFSLSAWFFLPLFFTLQLQTLSTTSAASLCCLLECPFWGQLDSSSSSSTSSAIFGSIFPPPSKVPAGKDSGNMGNHGGSGKYVNPDTVTHKGKGESSSKGKSSIYQNETPEPCYFSSSIYYGGQENYSPRTKNSESQQVFKKDDGEDDPNGNDSNSASRGNWWQGIMSVSSLNIDYGAKKSVKISID
ncbi:unnamed protein product [Dovyalis caffra]|uniref:Uncharacterized protein n=1 Tax=Dovyalis caffra TaxID=77055 RepID=A0AAV1QVF2_9ROSI|nr:unnamed protein product [Dovyalis caffra]